MKNITKEQLKLYYKFANKIVQLKKHRLFRFNNQIRIDAVEEGIFGIVESLSSFKEDKNCSLDTYIYKGIENRINNFIKTFNNQQKLNIISIETVDIPSEIHSKEAQTDSNKMLVEIDKIMNKIKSKDNSIPRNLQKNGDLLFTIYQEILIDEKSMVDLGRKIGISRQGVENHKRHLLSYLKYNLTEKFGDFLKQ